MATKDDRPGLLSKVAMFVRNPTKDWSELDQPVDNDANGYDKQALKAMIERKRQNDFVRKREFDQLRKLRDRDPGAIASLARQSHFQNSLASDLGGRAVTLKKIDEIEAQMSRQWWKSKNDGTSLPASGYPHTNTSMPSPGASEMEPVPGDSKLSASFAATEPLWVKREDGSQDADEFIPTQMSDMASVPGQEAPDSQGAMGDVDGGFSASRLFAIDMDVAEADPELEEAAIRFANGDNAGAENGLLAALRGQRSALAGTPVTTVSPEVQAWAMALLDLYRATNNQSAFEAACQEFALQAGNARHDWFALGDPAAATQAAALAAQAEPTSTIWDSPPSLDAPAMERLRHAMVSMPMPWYMGWSALERIEADAVPLLDGLFSSLCDEAVSLRFDGGFQLLRAVRALTPSGARDGTQTAWQLRMNVLRALGLQDDFELAALDYCVTCGVAPPTWIEPHCRFVGALRPLQVPLPGAARHTEQTADHGAQAFTLTLQGQIMGDTSHSLALLGTTPAPGQPVRMLCHDLVRVDFAAAGSILNWVVTRHAAGNEVQFVDLHRLVASFFHLIGINEYAKVMVRSN